MSLLEDEYEILKRNTFKQTKNEDICVLNIPTIASFTPFHNFVHLKESIDTIKNQEGTGELLTYPLFGLLISAVLCKLAKMSKRPSLIQQYQNTATESTANGKITNYTSLAIAALMAVFIIGSIIRSVSALFINIY